MLSGLRMPHFDGFQDLNRPFTTNLTQYRAMGRVDTLQSRTHPFVEIIGIAVWPLLGVNRRYIVITYHYLHLAVNMMLGY